MKSYRGKLKMGKRRRPALHSYNFDKGPVSPQHIMVCLSKILIYNLFLLVPGRGTKPSLGR